jgi:hypothetical protein
MAGIDLETYAWVATIALLIAALVTVYSRWDMLAGLTKAAAIGMIWGIGIVTAAVIVRYFGADLPEIVKIIGLGLAAAGVFFFFVWEVGVFVLSSVVWFVTGRPADSGWDSYARPAGAMVILLALPVALAQLFAIYSLRGLPFAPNTLSPEGTQAVKIALGGSTIEEALANRGFVIEEKNGMCTQYLRSIGFFDEAGSRDNRDRPAAAAVFGEDGPAWDVQESARYFWINQVLRALSFDIFETFGCSVTHIESSLDNAVRLSWIAVVKLYVSLVLMYVIFGGARSR